MRIFCCKKAVKNNLKKKFTLQTPIIFASFREITIKKTKKWKNVKKKIFFWPKLLNPWIKNFQSQEYKISL